MHTLRAALLGGCVMCAGTAFAQDAITQVNNKWYTDGQAAIDAALTIQPITTPAKNVILFVGDGFNLPSIFAARVFEGQLRGETGEENQLSFETMPHVALSKTYNTDAQVPDSAGTATAMVTGVKTYMGAISVDEVGPPGNCAASQGHEVTTLLELAEQVGMSTGVVTTARLSHATPATTYAHSPDRTWENDTNLPDEAVANGCVDIARQLIEFPFGDGVDVAMGGGRRNFMTVETEDPEYAGGAGRRQDGRNLTQEWVAGRDGAAYVWTADQLAELDTATVGPVLGLFDWSTMKYVIDRDTDAGGEPSLAQMTSFAIDYLSRNDEGYFLMVEGQGMDHASHIASARRMVTEAVAFHEAVQTAMDATDEQETLIVVTADHGHVITISGYPKRGNPILELVRGLDGKLMLDDSDLPYTTINYANGPGRRPELKTTETERGLELVIERPDLTKVDTEGPEYRQESMIPRGSETHSGEDVSIYARGPSAYLFQGVVEQNYIYHVMAHGLRITDRLSQ